MYKKSPSGAASPYYFKGGQLDPIHYGSYFDDMDGLAAVMAQEERYILEGHGGRRILIDVYETHFTDEMLLKLASHINVISTQITKLAFSGFSKKSIKIFEKKLRSCACPLAGKIGYYPEMEDAKDWLVSERF